MNLNDTVKMMNSADYKERFKAEYWQIKIRYEKLHRMTVKKELPVTKLVGNRIKGGPAMTREEAISRIQDHMERHRIGKYPHIRLKEAFELALSALRPVSREQVEKMWRGEWIGSADGYADGELVYDTWTCSECGYVIDEEDDPDMLPQFCPKCYAAMTDEAVDMVMERLEMMKND